MALLSFFFNFEWYKHPLSKILIMDISMFLSRCLTYGIKMYPFQQKRIIEASEKYKIPDLYLSEFDAEKTKKYLEALDYATREDSCDWAKGFEMLKQLGFEEVTNVVGHRAFISLRWIGS